MDSYKRPVKKYPKFFRDISDLEKQSDIRKRDGQAALKEVLKDLIDVIPIVAELELTEKFTHSNLILLHSVFHKTSKTLRRYGLEFLEIKKEQSLQVKKSRFYPMREQARRAALVVETNLLDEEE